MKVSNAILTATIAVLGFSAVTAQAKPAQYSPQCGQSELRMEKGSNEVNRAGAVIGSDYCEYTFYAKKGQKVSADIVGSSDLYPVLYGINSLDLSSQTVTLDKTGEHTIRVLQPRNQARAGNTPKPYYMTVTIK